MVGTAPFPSAAHHASAHLRGGHSGNRHRLLLALGLALSFGKLGIAGDGVPTLIFAIVGAVVLSVTTGLIDKPRSPGKASQMAMLALAVLTALIGLLDMNGAAAIGLYLTLFAGIARVVGATWQISLSKQTIFGASVWL